MQERRKQGGLDNGVRNTLGRSSHTNQLRVLVFCRAYVGISGREMCRLETVK